MFAIFAPPASAPDDATAQILFSDSAKAITLISRMPLDRQHPDHEAKVLAVRAVELLKANLAELRAQPNRTSSPQVPHRPRSNRRSPQPLEHRSQDSGSKRGSEVIEQFHALGASVMPVLKVSLAGQLGIGGRLSAGGFGSASSAGATFGLARVQQQFGIANLFFAFPRQRTFQWLVSGGAGALHVRVEGDGFNPYQGRTTQTWSALAKAGLGGAVTLGPNWRSPPSSRGSWRFLRRACWWAT